VHATLSPQAREAQLKKEHTAYLDDHPEARRLLNDYIAAALVEQPADVFGFAAEYFKGTATAVTEPADDAPPAATSGADAASADAAVPGSELRAYLKGLFESIDTDGSGSISQAELGAKMKADEELQSILEAAGGDGSFYVFEQLDLDGDGKVTWAEFEAMLGDL
jgi:hypothetical protein